MKEQDEEVLENEDIVSDFDNSPDGQLKQSLQEENLSDDDFDYQQGYGNAQSNYPEQPVKDSITKFYRGIIKIMKPKEIVRVANFSPKESRYAKMYLNYADFNEREKNHLIAAALRDMAVTEAAVSMGKKGFLGINVTTQRRVVARESGGQSGPKPASDWSKGDSGGQK